MNYPVPVFDSFGNQKTEADEFLLIKFSAETKRDPVLSPETASNNQRLISST